MEKNNLSKSVFTISGRHRFVACVIVVILVSCAAFAYHKLLDEAKQTTD